VAAVIAFFILSTFFVLGIATSVLPDWAEVLKYISVMEHMQTYSRGIVDSRYLAFDVITAALALFLSVRVVDARRYQ
jgi:ABC-2 type transport system permease protein